MAAIRHDLMTTPLPLPLHIAEAKATFISLMAKHFRLDGKPQ